MKIKCKKCGNEDINLFYFKNNKYYCRACLSFIGQLSQLSYKIKPVVTRAQIDYELSSSQKKIAKEIFYEEKEIFVKAVCGAGKTECVFPSIEKALQEGKRVGFAIPRKEVVKEIYERLKEVFQNVKIVAVYGGHYDDLKGDIVVFTIHQSYRYVNAFGLLIIDEYDEFPFNGNITLFNFVQKTCNQKRVYLSATFLNEELQDNKSVYLNKRYHYVNIPVPKVVLLNEILQYRFIIRKCLNKKENEILFIFTPTIKECEIMHKILKHAHIKSVVFHSKVPNKNDLFSLIKKRYYKIVITTSILERGITLEALNVIVYSSDHKIFDHRCLIQISGRVGRKKNHPSGYIYFLAKKSNKEIEKAISDIKKSNSLIEYGDMCDMQKEF